MEPSALAEITAAQSPVKLNMPLSFDEIEGSSTAPVTFVDEASHSDCLEEKLNAHSDSPFSQEPQELSPMPASEANTDQPAQLYMPRDLERQESSGSLWLQKHPIPPPKAVGKPASASPTSSGDSKAANAKRKNLFPKIRASERCGQCENCLNPQRKKACIEARRRQQELLEHKGSSHPAKQPKTQATSAASRAPAAASDPWGEELGRVMDHSGGVMHAKHVPTVLHLMQSAKSIQQRFPLCAVLQRSAPEVLHALVKHQALVTLQSWLLDSITHQKHKLASRVLSCLAKLPVTTASLQPPCELGKVVGKLRKDPGMDSATQEAAKQLVAKWKKMVEEESKRGSVAAVANAPATASKGVAPSKPATPAVSVSKPTSTTTPAPKPAAAKPVFAAMEDDDMFGAADKQRAHVKEAAAQQRKVMRIEVEATRGRAPGAAAAAPGDELGSPKADAKPAAGAEARAGEAAGGPVPAPAKPEASKASSSPFEGLGGYSAGVSMIGGASSSLILSSVTSSLRSAAARAAEAARRVPSPEPPKERKPKKKKVVWLGDADMVAVRWFRKVDPPVAAQSDVDLNAAPPSDTEPAQREASPPGFETAAKKEHLSEAQALRAHRIQEDEERLELQERLRQMIAAITWQPTPSMAAASPAVLAEVGVAQGEESAERAVQGRRVAQREASYYPTPDDIPPTPREPENPSDQGDSQNLDNIPKIPLSLEEAQALQQQPQTLQQQQLPPQQPQQQVGLTPPHHPHPHLSPQLGALSGGMPASTGGVHLLQPPPQLLQQQSPPFSQPLLLPQFPPPPPQQPHSLPIIDANALAQLASSGLLQLQPGFQLGGQQAQQPQHAQQQFGPPGTQLQPQVGQLLPQHLMQPQQAQQAPAGQGPAPGPAFQPQPQHQLPQLLLPGQPGAPPLLQPLPQQQPGAPLGQLLVQGGQLPPQQQQQQHVPWQAGQQQQQQQQRGPPPHHQPGGPPPPHTHRNQQQQQRQYEGGGTRRIPCRFFNTTGCNKGDQCRFAHVPMEGGGGGGLSGRGRSRGAGGRRGGGGIRGPRQAAPHLGQQGPCRPATP